MESFYLHRFNFWLLGCHQRAHGVVVSHPLRMRKALGSNPSVSIFHGLAPGQMRTGRNIWYSAGELVTLLNVFSFGSSSELLRMRFGFTTGGSNPC